MNLEDDRLEACVDNATAIAECALQDAYDNRDCSELDSELDRAFRAYRLAAKTIKDRIDALNRAES